MTKVITYRRTSTTNQNIGLEKQKNKIEEYCDAQDYTIVGDYSEQISGKTDLISTFESDMDVGGEIMNMSEREALQGALNKVKQFDIDKVIVYNPSRLARKMHYQGMLKELFEKAGARIEFVEVSGSWLEQTMKAVIAEYEGMQIVKRINDSLDQKKQDDEWLGRAPTGFKTSEEHNKLEPEDWLEDAIVAVREYKQTDQSRKLIAETSCGTIDEITPSRLRSLQKNIEEDKPDPKYVKGERPY